MSYTSLHGNGKNSHLAVNRCVVNVINANMPCCVFVWTQQSPGTGNYSMSCRVYAAAAAAAAAYRQHSAVADVGTLNYGRSCHDAASTFCARESAGLIGPVDGHCGAFSRFPTYGTYGVDGGSGRLCSAAGFVDSEGTGDVTSRYLACVGERGLVSEHHSNLSSLCGSEGFVAPPTHASSSSAALVELSDFVCRGDRLMPTGEEAITCNRYPLAGAVSERPTAVQWPRVDESSTSATTESLTTSSTTTRSSCLYSDAAKAAVSGAAKSACSQNETGALEKANVGVMNGGASSFPANPSGTSTCEKAKTSSSGSHRTHLTGLYT